MIGNKSKRLTRGPIYAVTAENCWHEYGMHRAIFNKLGAPLGDTDAGFLAWLRPRYTPPEHGEKKLKPQAE